MGDRLVGRSDHPERLPRRELVEVTEVPSSTKNGTACTTSDRVSEAVCLVWCEPGESSEEGPEERTYSRVTREK